MAYHHLALAAKNIKATHDFYERIMGFELVKVEIAPVASGGWGKHFFYRMDGNDSRFIAFWELNDTPNQDDHIYDLNEAANLPPFTNHYSFAVSSKEELQVWKEKWRTEGLSVLEIDHNWCHSIYTTDPSGNAVEFCLTTSQFTPEDRELALAALDMSEFNPSPAPASIKMWEPETA